MFVNIKKEVTLVNDVIISSESRKYVISKCVRVKEDISNDLFSDEKDSPVVRVDDITGIDGYYYFSTVKQLRIFPHLQYFRTMQQAMDGKYFFYKNSFKSLRVISMWQCRIRSASFLSGLINLQFLNLEENRVQDLRFLKHLDFLQDLFLQHNNISDPQTLRWLSGRRLRLVNLLNNPIGRFQQAKPFLLSIMPKTSQLMIESKNRSQQFDIKKYNQFTPEKHIQILVYKNEDLKDCVKYLNKKVISLKLTIENSCKEIYKIERWIQSFFE